MATTIVLKNSVTTTNTPSSLAQGEVAINVTDKKVWVGNAATTPIQIVNGGPDGVFTSVTDSGLTNTRVTYAGAGGLLKDSANITTDGTIITAAFSGAHNGTVGATTPAAGTFTTLTATNFNAASTFGFKNRIINGNMVVAQYGTGTTSATVTNARTYVCCDRWAYQCGAASKFTVAQSTTAPAGFINSLIATSSAATALGSSDYYALVQPIEGLNVSDLAWGTANAKTVTLSFQVYSSLTGTFGGSLSNGAANYSYPFSYSIPTANTWTQISITITGPTAGTWVTTNAASIFVWFGLGVGSTLSGTAGSWSANNYLSATGATSVVGTSGATFYITGVQFETGSTATTFDYRNYGTELAMCQRYYETMGADVTGSLLVSGNPSSAQQINTTFTYKVTKRTTPTVTKVGTWSVTNASQPIVFGPGVDSFLLYLNSTAGGASYAQNLSASYITISAEL